MITVELTTDQKLIKEIATHPVLWKKTYGEHTHLHRSMWVPAPGMQYLLLKHNGKVMGMFPFRMVTDILMEAHIYILPKFCKQWSILRALKAGIGHSIEHYGVKTFTCWTPDNCYHMINFLANLDWIPAGHIPNGTYYNGQQAGVLIYQIDAQHYLNVVKGISNSRIKNEVV